MNFTKMLSIATIATTIMVSSAFASNIDSGNAWARASAGTGKTGAAYFTMHNANDHEHTLLSVKSDVAKRVELHHHIMADGMMKMRQVKDGILIPAGKTIELKPGDYHVMLIGLHAPLKEGTTFPLTLVFDNGHETTLTVKVKSPSAMESGMGDMGHGADHGANHGTDMIHPADHGHTHQH